MDLNKMMTEAIIYSGARVVLDKEHIAIKQDAIIFDPDSMMRYTESLIKFVCEEVVSLEGKNLDD